MRELNHPLVNRLLLVVLLLNPLTACHRIPPRPEVLINVQGGDLSVKPVQEFTLSNGLRVLYLVDHTLPLIRGQLYIRGGSLSEGPSEQGIASVLGDQLREGGITRLSPEGLDKLLDSRGASIESGIGAEFGSVSFSTLSEDFDEIFGLFSEVILQPRFDPSRLALWKSQSLESIKRRKEEPELIASAVFNRVLYGKGSPLGELLTSKDIRSITVRRLRAFYQKLIRPNGSILVVHGDIAPEKLRASVERVFGGWQMNPAPLPALQQSDARARAGVYLVRGRFDQASIFMGHEGPKRLTPDTSSIAVFNRYFGYDAFGSLLFSEVRSKLGLAYSVTGALTSGPTTGQFVVMIGTRKEEAARAINAAKAVITRVQSELPPVSTVDQVKSSLRRAFPFNYATKGETLSRAAQLDLMGYPKDWDYGFSNRLAAVTPESVFQVGKERVDLSRLITVIVGDLKPEELQSALGVPVKVVRFNEVPEL